MPPVATVKPNGPEIRRLRSLRGWEARDLAHKISRHRRSIENAERGQTVSLVLVSQIARALGIDPHKIILSETGGEEPEVCAPTGSKVVAA
jgi:ribosome-binding protein aMBF1 (putative translation factor)